MHITILRPGEAHGFAPSELVVEISSTNCTSIEDDKKYWEEAGEDPDIVVDHQELELSEEAADCVNDLLAQGEPELLEEILNAMFRAARQFPKQ